MCENGEKASGTVKRFEYVLWRDFKAELASAAGAAPASKHDRRVGETSNRSANVAWLVVPCSTL
jgi:hypothetical protein